MSRRVLLSIALLAAVPVTAGGNGVSFQAQVAPILNRHCVACHLTGQEQGSIALHARVAYDNLVGVPSEQSDLVRVEPGATERSYLLLKLTGEHLAAGGSGEPMPMGGRSLAAEEIEVIRRWIAEGAGRDN